MEIIHELYKLADAFQINGLHYAVCGGLAVAIHGRPRLTVDIDMIIAAEDMIQAARIAAGIGFDDVSGWVSLPENSLRVHRLYRINKLVDGNFLTLDLLEADSNSNPLLADRETFVVEGHSIQALSKEALITMKSDSKRTKDKLDIELLNDESD